MYPYLGLDTTFTTTDADAIRPGTIAPDPDPTSGKVYKWVKYSDGTGDLDVAVGDVVCYVDDSGYGSHTVIADVGDASGALIGAGVVAAAVTVDATYMWIQIKGPATVNQTIAGSAGDGQMLVPGGDKALTLAAESDSSAALPHVCAICVDADAKEIICDFPW